MTVEDYFKEMEMSMMRADVHEDEEATMARFLGGLRPDIADIVELQHYLDMGELLDKAIKVERRFKRRGTVRQNSNFQSKNWRNTPLKREDRPSSGPHFAASNGNSRGTLSPTTLPSQPTSNEGFKSQPEVSKSRTRDTKCFKCQGFGHIVSQCPNQRTLIMLPNGDLLTDDEDDEHEGMPSLEVEEDELEEIPVNDTVGYLVARRALATQASRDELQRENIFYSRCHIHNKEYHDVFPENIPNGLPPLRGIEHQIDFIPEASLPNKAPYRINPEETKEQQRQVEELLGKGWIRESLNPCAVPVLLVPKKDGGWRMCTDCRAINAITGFLYYKDKLCIPLSSMRPLLVREAHGGGLMGHFGVTKTLFTLQEHFFWPRMKRDVEQHIQSHPQTDGQTEVVNRTLSTSLRAIIKKNIKIWEDCLLRVEFAYNRTIHTATQYSPFEIVYGFNPLTPLDLSPLPDHERVNMDGKKKVDFVRDLHTKVRATIEKRTLQYIQNANKGRRKMVFEPGDWVWIDMRKKRFPLQRRNKLLPRGDGPFQVMEKINDNAYKLDLPGEYGVYATFNVADLSPFYADDELDLGTNRLQEEGIDDGAPRVNGDQVIQVPQGPVTRARTKKLHESLQVLVCTIQERIGDDLKTIEGLENEDSTIYTLLQVDEPSED
ncbi:uncharacterized protein [Coffea arabica]|uniref:CCHC-type domain-containing protein n=1 Tax=Coffea arabica TaxID=13443 RepID=A0ABM4WPN9_COFAR